MLRFNYISWEWNFPPLLRQAVPSQDSAPRSYPHIAEQSSYTNRCLACAKDQVLYAIVLSDEDLAQLATPEEFINTLDAVDTGLLGTIVELLTHKYGL